VALPAEGTVWDQVKRRLELPAATQFHQAVASGLLWTTLGALSPRESMPP
jgi:hypothetical protein